MSYTADGIAAIRQIGSVYAAQILKGVSPTFPTGAPILEFCRQKLNLFKGR